jgi:hypothetical protein
MFNDFNDLETFRASDKRTSSDFNKYLKYLNTFKKNKIMILYGDLKFMMTEIINRGVIN